jgi:PAS domain S-box-containing protein
MNLDALFNDFLTSGTRLADPETLRKLKVSNAFQLVFVMCASFLGFLYFYLGALPLFYAAIGAAFLMITSLLLLRRTKNLALGSHYALLISWAWLLHLSWHTGAVSREGILEPTFFLNAALVLLSIFLLGYSGGAVWATVVFLEAGLIIYLHRMDYSFPALIPQDVAPIYSLGAYMVALLCILLTAFLFEKEKEDALARDREKSGALRESGRTIDNILRSFPLPTFILDRNHRVIHWNGACADLAGISESEILGKRVWDGFFVDERGSVADILIEDPHALASDCGDAGARANEDAGLSLDLSLPGLNGGAAVRVTASPILDQKGLVRGAVQTIQVAGPPGAEEPSRGGGPAGPIQSSFAFPVFHVDPQANVTYWNEVCEREYRVSAAEMVGKSIFSLVAKNYKPAFEEMIAAVFRGDSVSGKAFKYYTRDGKPVYVLSYARLGGEGKNGKECVVTNADVTELRLKMKRVELYASETKEKLKSLSEEHELLKRNIASFIRKKDDGRSG